MDFDPALDVHASAVQEAGHVATEVEGRIHFFGIFAPDPKEKRLALLLGCGHGRNYKLWEILVIGAFRTFGVPA